MKRNLLIIILLVMSLLSAFWATAQDSSTYGGNGTIATIIPNNTPKLIADETWRTYTKTGAKIVTYSDSIYKDLFLYFGDKFNKITIQRKKDRNGEYKEYTMLMSAQTGADISNWSNHYFKKHIN